MASVIHSWDLSRELPKDENELRSLYQSTLQGKRAIILLDDAFDSTQVERLLPPAGNLLLVTSRDTIVLPGAQILYLNEHPFSPADAAQFLLSIEPRIGIDAPNLAKLCGYLPLALRQAASTLRQRHSLAVTDYLVRLEKNRPAQLSAVIATLRLSYDLLPPERQLRFRALGIFSGSFDRPAAATLLELDEEGTAETLESLAAGSLIAWDETARRYRLHDLVRDFALGLLSPEEIETLHLRHATHYRNIGIEAETLYNQGGENALRGLELFDSERTQIDAAFDWLQPRHDRTSAELLISLVDAVRNVAGLRLSPPQSIRWREAQLAAARFIGNYKAEGEALNNLGIAYRHLGNPRKALEFFRQALEIARNTSGEMGLGNILGNLGNTYIDLGDANRAIEVFDRCLSVHRQIGDHKGEYKDLGNLGNAYSMLRDASKAIEFYEKVLTIAYEIGDQQGQANSLCNLGSNYAALGNLPKAIESHERSLVITRAIQDKRCELNVLYNLGIAYRRSGDVDKSIQFCQQALDIARDVKSPRGEANALSGLGNAYTELGDHKKAVELHEKSRRISEEMGDRHGEATALWNSANAFWELGEKSEAIRRAEAALRIREEIKDPDAAKVRAFLARWRDEMP